MKPTRAIANFDSTTGMLRALMRYLRGHDFPSLGLETPAAAAAPLVNALPERLREQLYIWSGWREAIPPERLREVDAEAIAGWMAAQYPRRRYQAALVGSASGAAVHLGAALGAPWLPQTFLVPVRRSGVHPDEPRAGMEWGATAAPALLARNPELQLHHMHDPSQDRLMIQRMTYFRVKRLRLGDAFERFLRERLAPGATIFLLECGLTWPTTRVGERHLFQFGALGGASPDEFHGGSSRVEEYLARYGSRRRRWDPPEPDGERPEAEWGFEPALRADVERLARERGYRVRRVVFGEPQDLSPFVAELYRFWYERRGLPANRLLVESFIVLEPFWTLRSGFVPYWTTFPVEPAADALERYLVEAAPYDEIRVMLFSHGTDSIGLAPIQRWRAVFGRARLTGGFVGVDERKFPRDFATFVRYHKELKRLGGRYPLPEPLSLAELDRFLVEAADRHPVRWLEAAAA